MLPIVHLLRLLRWPHAARGFPADGDKIVHLRRRVLMLKEGDQAPGFTLPSDDGSEISLKDFRGRHVVLFFYPKASTPG